MRLLSDLYKQGLYDCSCIGQYTLDGCIGIQCMITMYLIKSLDFTFFVMITQELVQIAITFVGNGTETFSIKWIECSNTEMFKCASGSYTQLHQYMILNTNITHTATTVRLDLNKIVMCCVSPPNPKTKCVTYTPDVNEPGI